MCRIYFELPQNFQKFWILAKIEKKNRWFQVTLSKRFSYFVIFFDIFYSNSYWNSKSVQRPTNVPGLQILWMKSSKNRQILQSEKVKGTQISVGVCQCEQCLCLPPFYGSLPSVLATFFRLRSDPRLRRVNWYY